ncbi:MAG TPA: hypothetical protein VJV03_08070 [Pyrinomonadaceae bacterium]|nr:hypothetical protein [Pyrinomonadaceae bacterium]
MRYFLGVMALTGYVLLLSTFVSENVEGGVAGGNKIDTQRTGRTIVTTYEGGQKIVYGANAGHGTRLRIVSAVTFGVGLVLAVLLAVRRELPVGQLIGRSLGMAFVGVVIAFITGMPIAVVLKRAGPGAFWVAIVLLCVTALFLFSFIGRKIYKPGT